MKNEVLKPCFSGRGAATSTIPVSVRKRQREIAEMHRERARYHRESFDTQETDQNWRNVAACHEHLADLLTHHEYRPSRVPEEGWVPTVPRGFEERTVTGSVALMCAEG